MSPRDVRSSNGGTEGPGPAVADAPDFRALFEATPGIVLVLSPDAPRFTMLAASDERLAATLTTREQIVGRPLFEVFADANPENPEPSGVANLRASLETVLRTCAPHRMAVQRYDLRRADGAWEVRHWAPRNVPVPGPDGAVRYIVHHVEDVTEAVERAAAHERLRGEYAESEALRRALEDANARLRAQQLELEAANRQLQDQAVELELQAAELHDAAARLAERTDEAEALAARLLTSEVHGRAVFAHAAVGMGRVSFDDARWLDVNDAFCRMLGYERAALLATPWPAITHPDDLDLDLAPFRRMAAGEIEAYTVEKRFVHAAGHHVWARLTLSLVRDAEGRPDYEVAVIEDVTTRRLAEAERERLVAALDVERVRLADVLRQAPVAVAVMRGRTVDDLAYALVNPRYAEAVTAGRETRGRRVRDVLPELDDAHLAVLQGVLDTGVPFVASEYHVPLDRDGDGVPEDCYFSFVYHPLVDADGRVEGLVAVGTEVTDSVRARRDAERSREQADAARAEAEAARVAVDAERARLAGVLAAMGDAHIALDRDWRVVGMNRAAERVNLRPAAHFLGRDHWEAWPAALGTHIEREYRRAMTERVPVRLEANYHEPGVLDTWLELDVVPTADGGVGVFFRDITARKRAEAAREQALAAERAARAEAEAARADAEDANRAKSQFLANMSHELRTPLNAIGGYAQLLDMGLHGPVTDAQRGALARVEGAQRRLLALINDVLNYAKLEGGRVEYTLGVVDVRDVVADVTPLVEPQLAAKGLALDVRLPDGPCTVWADREKLGQVLVNLLSNATKFTDARDPVTGAPGRVTVAVASRRGAADAVFLRVTDTGRGIPRDKQAAIFEPFVQVRAGAGSAYAQATEGTGLGLAISRDLARGMGGELRVRSREGDGAAFTVALRRAVPGGDTALDRRTREDRRREAERRSGADRRTDGRGGV
jgi:PAS domain S-box-containing protein